MVIKEILTCDWSATRSSHFRVNRLAFPLSMNKGNEAGDTVVPFSDDDLAGTDCDEVPDLCVSARHLGDSGWFEEEVMFDEVARELV